MISFELSQEQSIARSMVSEFAKKVLRPIARKVDDAQSIDGATLDQIWSLGIVQSLASGDEAALQEAAINSALMLEEIGWADAVFGLALTAPLGFVRAIVEQGSAAQKEKLLPQFAGDSYRAAAVAVSEPGFLGDIGSLASMAHADGDGYRLTGAKTQVPFASSCSHFLVVAMLDGKPDAFIVPRDSEGVEVAAPDGNLGLSAAGLATVRFKDVAVAAEMRLGGNKGADIQRLIDTSRLGASAILVGVCRGVYEHSVAYTKERVAHGSAIARKQSVAFRLVDMFTETDASRWMCWRTATQLDQKVDATRSAALTHLYVTEQASWITDEGVQLMGGHGFMQANPVELWYRNAKSLSLLQGAVSA